MPLHANGSDLPLSSSASRAKHTSKANLIIEGELAEAINGKKVKSTSQVFT